MHKDQLSVRLGRLLGRTAIGLIALGALAVGCGGGGGDDDFDGTVTPGFFVGTTAQDEPMSIQVDSIRAVFVSCGGLGFQYFAVYDPPEPVSVDGAFGVNIADGLRFLTITGEFKNADHIEGTISGDPFCEGDFDLQRCNPEDPKCQDVNPENHIPDGIQPTATPTRTVTPTPTLTVTPTGSATPIATGLTPTPASPVVTPTPDTPDLCGNGVVDEDDNEECDGTNLNGQTCQTQDFAGGTLRCDDTCSFDTEDCVDE